MERKSSLEIQIDNLMVTRDKKYIPARDRAWFWNTFKSLKAQGARFDKAWDETCWALLYSYGFLK